MVMPIVLNKNQAGDAYVNTGIFAYETLPETLYEQMQKQQDVDVTESEEVECEVDTDTIRLYTNAISNLSRRHRQKRK